MRARLCASHCGVLTLLAFAHQDRLGEGYAVASVSPTAAAAKLKAEAAEAAVLMKSPPKSDDAAPASTQRALNTKEEEGTKPANEAAKEQKSKSKQQKVTAAEGKRPLVYYVFHYCRRAGLWMIGSTLGAVLTQATNLVLFAWYVCGHSSLVTAPPPVQVSCAALGVVHQKLSSCLAF